MLRGALLGGSAPVQNTNLFEKKDSLFWEGCRTLPDPAKGGCARTTPPLDSPCGVILRHGGRIRSKSDGGRGLQGWGVPLHHGVVLPPNLQYLF